jgi:hypothetical protein
MDCQSSSTALFIERTSESEALLVAQVACPRRGFVRLHESRVITAAYEKHSEPAQALDVA